MEKVTPSPFKGLLFQMKLVIIINAFRDVAQVVERYFREVEVASSSLVIPIRKVFESAVVAGVRRLFLLS